MISKKKKAFLTSLVLIIVFLTGTFVATDVITIYFAQFSQNYSPITKLLCSLLSVIIALFIGKNNISKKDYIILAIAMTICFIGDIFITTHNYWYNHPNVFLTGGILFIISVSFLTYRETQKVFLFLKKIPYKEF